MSMGDNIKPMARAVTERIARRVGMDGAELAVWVDRHWHCAAAEIEAGIVDESGELRGDYSLEERLAAFRDHISRQK